MGAIRSAKKRIKQRRLLFMQVAFTALAFLVMVVLSYLFARGIVNMTMTRYADSVYVYARTKVEADLQETRTILGAVSQTIRKMLMRGEDVGDLGGYIDDITLYMRNSEHRMSGEIELFGYFETLPGGPVFLNSANWAPDGAYEPKEQPWYNAAVASQGEIMETSPYVCLMTNTIVVSYTRNIIDGEGRSLGVISMNVPVDNIGRDIVEIALDRGGYGMLLDHNLNVIAHADPEYVGGNLQDGTNSVAVFAGELLAGKDISERAFINRKGEEAVAFIWKLPNGWYLGLLTPKGPFYQGLYNMMYTLCVLGASLSTALICILIRIDLTKNKADEVSRQKSAFLANMSHEMRTPMNAIIGMAAIGKSASGIERKDYCLMKIEDASNHLLGVINDILDMSKIEANKIELSPTEFDFEKMLQRVVNVVNFRVEDKRQKLTVHIDKAIPRHLFGDSQRLAQIVANLLSNAVKFTPEGGMITLTSHMVRKEGDGCIIQISVADSGIGLSEEQKTKLFQPFQQAEANTARKYGGTGLGLSISKNIVEMMGGAIWVESELGHGATFAFEVFIKTGETKEGKLAIKSANIRDIRTLTVDGDPDVLKHFKEMMEEFGLDCDTAVSAEEALRLVSRNGYYDFCFIDWKLPDINGVELVKALRSKGSAAENTVIIMISAAEWDTIKTEAQEAGAKSFLSKPIFPSGITDTINEVLGPGQLQTDNVLEDVAQLFSGRSILLAEDVEINREIVQALLEPTSLNIEFAGNGEEAVQMFSESPDKYDLILMDVQMPVMDGFEATRKIRAMDIPNAKGIPIVALTANVFREDIERCIETGMNGHLGKPLDYNEVITKLRLYLRPDDDSGFDKAAS